MSYFIAFLSMTHKTRHSIMGFAATVYLKKTILCFHAINPVPLPFTDTYKHDIQDGFKSVFPTHLPLPKEAKNISLKLFQTMSIVNTTLLFHTQYLEHKEEFTLITDQGQLQSRNVMATERLPIYSSAVSKAPYGTASIWRSGGLQIDTYGTLNSWTLQEYITIIRYINYFL